MHHQQNHIWFKGKNLKTKHINAIKCMFRNHVNRTTDTCLLFISEWFQKA